MMLHTQRPVRRQTCRAGRQGVGGETLLEVVSHFTLGISDLSDFFLVCVCLCFEPCGILVLQPGTEAGPIRESTES